MCNSKCSERQPERVTTGTFTQQQELLHITILHLYYRIAAVTAGPLRFYSPISGIGQFLPLVFLMHFLFHLHMLSFLMFFYVVLCIFYAFYLFCVGTREILGGFCR